MSPSLHSLTHGRFRGRFDRGVPIVSILLEWQRRARARRHLAELDDRLLRDVGLTRADVAPEIAKPFWRA